MPSSLQSGTIFFNCLSYVEEGSMVVEHSVLRMPRCGMVGVVLDGGMQLLGHTLHPFPLLNCSRRAAVEGRKGLD